MSKVSMFGTMTCAEGRAEELEAALASMTEIAEGMEGVESYGYHRDDDGNYRFFALMTNMEATQTHGQSAEMQAAIGAVMPLLAGPPQMSMTTPI